MRPVLAKWVSDADALYHIQRFGLRDTPLPLSHIRTRGDDYYLSLVGELFYRISNPYEDPVEWSRLGNALTQVGIGDGAGETVAQPGILASETALFAASAFYFGGYSASAYLTFKATGPAEVTETYRACYEMLSRPSTIQSNIVRALIGAVRRGEMQVIHNLTAQITDQEAKALQLGPDEWVGSRLFKKMLERFESTNIRAVLPDGQDAFWDMLVRSLLNQTPPVWDFFPSQIDAIRSGLPYIILFKNRLHKCVRRVCVEHDVHLRRHFIWEFQKLPPR
jgi:helicase